MANSDMWMGAAPSENSIQMNPVLKLEEDPASTENLDVKDTQNFKEVVEQEWYTSSGPSLMELSSYGSMSMLDPSLGFDSTSNLISSFRSAQSMDDHGSSAGLLSSISPGLGISIDSLQQGGQISRSTGLPTTTLSFNHQTKAPDNPKRADSLSKSPPTSNDSSAEKGIRPQDAPPGGRMDVSDDGEDYDVDDSGDGGSGENGEGRKGRPPAKNLMAERRRRKKLNDRLYMLRSVVPKITKMDRASILGDAIEYLKELLQRINDIKKELEDATLNPSATSTPPKTPQKEECPVLPNPESQPPRVEVRKREGQAMNIHMFCARRPGLLLNTVRALDAMGLDVQQAVISCFNGFALDLFRAEAKNGDIGADEIKAVLLLTAGCGMHSGQ